MIDGLLKKIAEKENAIIMRLNKDGLILDVYAAGKYNSIIPPEEVKGYYIKDIIGPTVCMAMEDIKTVLKTQKPIENTYYFWNNPAAQRWVRVTPLKNRPDQVVVIHKKEPF